MKRLIFVLSLMLLAVPTMADVTVTATGCDSNIITISYNVTGEPNLVRAYALDVIVTGANIISVQDADPNYGIYPGSIQINASGVITDEGSPIADVSFPGTKPGLDSNAVTIEMGSLYYGDINEPDNSGTLIVLGCDSTVSEVALAENTTRAGVVMEDAAGPTGTLTLTGCGGGCFPTCRATEHAQWLLVGSPTSWCDAVQCYGNADGLLNTEKGLIDHWVGLPDLQILAKGYKQDYSYDPAVDGPDPDSDPDTWIAADFTRSFETEKGIPYDIRVGLQDLQRMAAYWKGPNDGKPAPPTDCMDCP